MALFSKSLILKIRRGAIGIIPTDTLYGLVGLAQNKKTVARIYDVKGRDDTKPFIILITSLSDLKTFEVELDEKTHKKLNQFWPGKISVIFSCQSKKLSYLHRGTNSLGFRLPNDRPLVSLIEETGPLVAPSANPTGLKPAKNIAEAKKYFGDTIDFFIDGGKLGDEASTIVEIVGKNVKIIRKGADFQKVEKVV